MNSNHLYIHDTDLHTHTHAHTNIRMHTHTDTRAHARTHTHALTHTHMRHTMNELWWWRRRVIDWSGLISERYHWNHWSAGGWTLSGTGRLRWCGKQEASFPMSRVFRPLYYPCASLFSEIFVLRRNYSCAVEGMLKSKTVIKNRVCIHCYYRFDIDEDNYDQSRPCYHHLSSSSSSSSSCSISGISSVFVLLALLISCYHEYLIITW